ncbi:MAG: hypothetical protein NVS9B8_16520 [Candidatus Limnocylindrales bacterium]
MTRPGEAAVPRPAIAVRTGHADPARGTSSISADLERKVAAAVEQTVARTIFLARNPALRTALDLFDQAELPAVRASADEAWIATQVARRSAHIRRVAEILGLDPDATLALVGSSGWAAVTGPIKQ